METLYENPDYRFNWAEIGYFKKWWDQQSEATHNRFKTLNKKG
jgi:hypothetical protein